MEINNKLKRGFAGTVLSALILLVVRNPSNTNRLPCWSWLNRLVDVLTVISQGDTIN